MFSFHKPKIYRSIKGCCICRAKSSSSRFTDSKKYENDFERCFKIVEKRAGEICNACVLLVKRWKKLPSGSNRNWHHVVDARAGPGTKSIMKMKSKHKEELRLKKKHKHIHRPKPPQSPGGLSDDILMGDDCHSDGDSHSTGSSPPPSDCSDDEETIRKERPGKSRRRKASPVRFSSFLDLTYWKKTEICCGIIFKGANGECLVDTNLLRPCRTCKPSSHHSASPAPHSHEASPMPDELRTPLASDLCSPDDELRTPDIADGSSQDSSSSLPDYTTSNLQEAASSLQQAAETVLDLSLPKANLPHPPCIPMEA